MSHDRTYAKEPEPRHGHIKVGLSVEDTNVVVGMGEQKESRGGIVTAFTA